LTAGDLSIAVEAATKQEPCIRIDRSIGSDPEMCFASIKMHEAAKPHRDCVLGVGLAGDLFGLSPQVCGRHVEVAIHLRRRVAGAAAQDGGLAS
jgi:hypothetical protein